MSSEGQQWALDQLRDIEKAAQGSFEIVGAEMPATPGSSLVVDISIDCSGYARKPEGIALHARERLSIRIPSDFPLDQPSTQFSHSRYAGTPHVQWGRHICLYLAPDSEWQPNDGMFGFMQRLHEWLRASALGELDPVGLPLHPPVAYHSGAAPLVIPRVNTPVPEPPWWAGYAEVTREDDAYVELGAWFKHDADIPARRLAPAILLPSDMPFEYPSTIGALKTVLVERFVPIEIIRLLFSLGALRNEEGKPLLFVLGAAMRGIVGGERKQHLASWYVGADRATQWRARVLSADEANPVTDQEFETWAATTNIYWCKVFEERPEIVVARDSETPMSWWRGRHATVLGCGAIGSAIAMLLGRAGVAKLQLYDHKIVTPGILVRQLFDRKQIGTGKASATQFNVRYMNPNIDVVAESENVVSALQDAEKVAKLLESDAIINATASSRVAAALERHFREWPKQHPPIVSMVIGHNADCGCMTYSVQGAVGITVDLDRRCKIALANATNLQDFLDEFWPRAVDRSRLFQPEPGCSDPTFRGSAADVLALSSIMLNTTSRYLAEADGAGSRAYGFRIAHAVSGDSKPREFVRAWVPDRILVERRKGYQIRVDIAAEEALLGWMRRSKRLRGPRVETGGLLFGQIDDFLKVIWVTEVSGPPPDSLASPEGFVCGIRGASQLNAEKMQRTRGAVSFVGMWHTHPYAEPTPSGTDWKAMRDLFDRPDFKGRRFLMMIVGGQIEAPLFSGSLFGRADC